MNHSMSPSLQKLISSAANHYVKFVSSYMYMHKRFCFTYNLRQNLLNAFLTKGIHWMCQMVQLNLAAVLEVVIVYHQPKWQNHLRMSGRCGMRNLIDLFVLLRIFRCKEHCIFFSSNIEYQPLRRSRSMYFKSKDLFYPSMTGYAFVLP